MRIKNFGIFFVLSILISVSLNSCLVIDSVIMDSQGIKPGEVADIEMGLRNNGGEDVEDVSVFLDLKDVDLAPFDSSSEFGIDEIREDRTRYARFKIIALDSAKPGTYKIPIRISYKEEGVEKIKDSLISIKVHSEPVLGVVAEENLLLKGEDNIVSIMIINKGLSDAKFLEVEVGSGKFSLLSSKKVYVGDVDSDDFDTVDFNVFFKSSVSDRVSFPITLKYQDVFNNDYEEGFDVFLKVYSRERAEELGLIEKGYVGQIISGVIILIVLWFVYRWWRKRKKNKKKALEMEEF